MARALLWFIGLTLLVSAAAETVKVERGTFGLVDAVVVAGWSALGTAWLAAWATRGR